VGNYCYDPERKGPQFDRRRLLQLGGLSGLSLAHLLQAQAVQAARHVDRKSSARIKSCIFIFYFGGPSHLDTFDMKPAAPAEVRGEFRSIATTVPGLRICEHLPRLARVMHKVALIRSMSHAMRNHDPACTTTFTGRTPPRGDTENFSAVGDAAAAPGYGALLSYLRRGQPAGLPAAALPFFIRTCFPPPARPADSSARPTPRS
jgi:hypothetical protein